jgi:pimeloyl-ACP methyl ester carboxylesterase
MYTTTSADGTAIAYDRDGSGPPIIMVVGAFNTRATTAPLAAALADTFTVLNYDRRGRGDSGDTLPYSVQREIEDIDALIAEAGGSAALFGYSSGATLALRAAADGLAITKLALYDPPFVVDDSRPLLPASGGRHPPGGGRADATGALPPWPRSDRPHAGLRRDGHRRPRAPARPCRFRRDANARDRRRAQSADHARRRGGARPGPRRRSPLHARGSESRHLRGCHSASTQEIPLQLARLRRPSSATEIPRDGAAGRRTASRSSATRPSPRAGVARRAPTGQAPAQRW